MITFDSSVNMYFVKINELTIYGKSVDDVMINCTYAQKLLKVVTPIE